ncbi:MAG: hypothetical protein ABJE99_05140 [Roseobacter sp.]
MQATTVGIDLAKHVFQVHGRTMGGGVVFNRAIRRAELTQFVTNLGPDVRLIPANYVKPYVKRGQSGANAAEAICEAVTRPTLCSQKGVFTSLRGPFVAPKSEE